MRIRAWVAASLMAALFVPTAAADGIAPVTPTLVAHYAYEYCAASGARRALSQQHRAVARRYLENARADMGLTQDLQERVNRALDEGCD